jgi:alpha-beta hydrolase superfamily lysophospholipase
MAAMQENDFRLPAQDATPLFVRSFLPASAPSALLQVSHGMAEHSARYARLAEALCEHGFGVYASDHRGHGRTAQKPEDLGIFAESDGWRKVVADQITLLDELKSRHPGLPIFLLGHSGVTRCRVSCSAVPPTTALSPTRRPGSSSRPSVRAWACAGRAP